MRYDVGDGVRLDVGGPVAPHSCAEAEAANSYTGCEFWPTVTFNYVWGEYFKFAVVVANASDAVANVTVTRGGTMVAVAAVDPGGLQTLELPWVPELKGTSEFGSQTEFTYDAKNTRVVDGAYRLTSDRPVTAYQFNALRYEIVPKPASCPDFLHPGRCFSYSNDASLLFPTSALTSNYVVTSWRNDTYSDFFSVTATEDDTVISIVSTVDSNNGWPYPLAQGVPTEFTLAAGEVMAFVSNYGAGRDFSGTFVTAADDKPIQVISGVPCVNIPGTSVEACDHVEETVLPVDALGSDYLVSPPTVPGGGQVGTVRITAIVDGTDLQFDPAIHAPITLAQGQTLDLPDVVDDFRVWSSGPAFGVAQFMHGYGQTGAGDPSQSIAIPTEQFRLSYIFLAPEDYDTSYVAVTAPVGAEVVLDGTAVPATAFAPIGATGMAVAKVVLQETGAHRASSEQPFGIVVYGYGEYTSYMYPGGLGLERITEPPPPPVG